MTETPDNPPENPYEEATEEGYEGEQRVDNNEEQTLTGQSDPHMEGLTPGSGAEGDTVRIAGNGLANVTSVTFGGTDAEYTVEGDSLINATVPAGSGTVDVAVVTPEGGTDLGDAFTYAGSESPA